MKKMNKKGFTLIEMLAVIAIIAVLVAIVIPVVGNATEKAKEAADVANIRAKIAEVTTTALANGTEAANDLGATVTMTQETEGFVTDVTTTCENASFDLLTDMDNIGGIAKDKFNVGKGATYTITIDAKGAFTVAEKKASNS